jgi:hypothetical protein
LGSRSTRIWGGGRCNIVLKYYFVADGCSPTEPDGRMFPLPHLCEGMPSTQNIPISLCENFLSDNWLAVGNPLCLCRVHRLVGTPSLHIHRELLGNPVIINKKGGTDAGTS